MHNCLKLGENSNLVSAGSAATGVNVMDISKNEKIDISKEEHTEVSPQEEGKMDTAQEDDGVGLSSKEEKEMDISAEVFRIFASILEMDMPELKGWFVKSGYQAGEFRELSERDWRGFHSLHPLHNAARSGFGPSTVYLSFLYDHCHLLCQEPKVFTSPLLTMKQKAVKLQRNLLITSMLLALSMNFALLAFAIGGGTVLLPVFMFTANMCLTILIDGGVFCLDSCSTYSSVLNL